MRIDLRRGTLPFTLFDRPLVLDTNVWVLTQGPFIDSKRREFTLYSHLLHEMSRSEHRILIFQCIVSEYVHVSMNERRQSALEEVPGDLLTGKQFRKTELYASIMRDVGDDIYHILNRCEQMSDRFHEVDVDRRIKDCETGRLDFNDVLIRESCRHYGAILVTHDADFVDEDIPIASANRRFFR